jgi:meiosis induction protein kinase IME2/SME1
LMWDPKARPTSSQALAHEFFIDAVDPLRPKSSTSKILGRKHSDLSYRGSKDLSEIAPTSSKSSWFRKSLIGRSDSTTGMVQPSGKENVAPRPDPVHAITEIPAAKTRPQAGKRSTWTNGQSTVAPMPILPTIKPISPLSDTVTAQADSRTPSYSDAYVSAGQRGLNMDDKVAKKIGRQLSVASTNNHYADIHRQQAEMALTGNTGLSSPPNGQKESFFSHLRKRARRFSGRQSQTPISPKSMDIEAQAGCGPWASNRSSMIVDGAQVPPPIQKVDTYEALDKALRNVQQNLDSPQSSNAPPLPSHLMNPSSVLKRHHSLPQQQPRSVDNLRTVGPISSRTRRSQVPGGARQYETPDEEDELLDEVLSNTHKVMKRLDRNSTQNDTRQALRQSNSNLGLSNPYPTPSPSASGSAVLFGHQHTTPSKAPTNNKQSSTPPYDFEENEWATSAAASIFAASSRF